MKLNAHHEDTKNTQVHEENYHLIINHLIPHAAKRFSSCFFVFFVSSW